MQGSIPESRAVMEAMGVPHQNIPRAADLAAKFPPLTPKEVRWGKGVLGRACPVGGWAGTQAGCLAGVRYCTHADENVDGWWFITLPESSTYPGLYYTGIR